MYRVTSIINFYDWIETNMEMGLEDFGQFYHEIATPRSWNFNLRDDIVKWCL